MSRLIHLSVSLPSCDHSHVASGYKPNSKLPLKESLRAGRGQNLRHSPKEHQYLK